MYVAISIYEAIGANTVTKERSKNTRPARANHTEKRKPSFQNRPRSPRFEQQHTAPIVLQDEQDETTLVEGRNAVSELLESGRDCDKIFVAEGGRHADILAKAKQRGIPTVVCDRRKLDAMCVTENHQGVIAQAAAHEYASLDDLFAVAQERGQNPLFIICDGIEDPHNLGAMIRSAETAGAHGIIIPKRRAVGLTAAVARASAGAIEHIGIHKVTNLPSLLDELKERGVWIFGAEADGTVGLYDADFAGATAIVIGSEAEGISRLVRQKCDFIVSIPMQGRVNSLNASNAAAVLLYEAVRRRWKGE